MHRDWNWSEAEQHFRHAIELNPSNADLHHDYAHLLLVLRRDRESVAETERAVALDPFNPMLNACLGWHHLFAGQYDQAIEAAEQALRIQPANFWARMNLGWAFEQKAMYRQAIDEFTRAEAQKPMGMDMEMSSTGAKMPPGDKPSPASMAQPMSSGQMPMPMSPEMAASSRQIGATRTDLVVLAAASLGHALGLAGDRPAAQTLLDSLLRQRQRGYVSPYDLALLYLGLGEKNQAMEWLQRAHQERSSLLVFASREPRLATLRLDPRFAKLMREFALPQ
jgi:serine/threonine-protein kinase